MTRLWLLLALLTAAPSPAEVSGQPSGAGAEHALLLAGRTAVVEMRTAALIMSGQAGGALPIAIAAVPDGESCGDGACRFTAVIEIDGAALRDASRVGPLPIEVFAYVLGTELDVLEQRSLSLDAGAPEHRRLLANTGLKVFLPLEVTPGEHLLRVLVQAGESFGLRGLTLRAGAAAAAGAPPGSRSRVLAPVFHELAGPWLLAAPAGVEILLPPPFGLEAASVLPAARPQMPAGGSLPGEVFTAGDPVAGDLIALVRKPGSETVEAPLTAGDRAIGRGSLAIVFSPPPGVGPGLWEVAVAGSPGARSDFVPIFIEHPTPAAANAEALAGAPADRAPKPLTGSKRKLERAARESYARALQQLAAGDRQRAMTTLMAGEERVVEALDAEAVGVLSHAESRFLAALPAADWGCLLPVVLLHLDVSRAYREGDRRILAHHATRMTIDLADAYARKLDSPQARAEAARAFTSLGGYFQHGGALSQAERQFSRALELAGDQAALLGLATLYEKRGLFDRAVPVLERLVEARPEHAEGALRLALNRARNGQTAAAEEALGELAGGRESGWVELLAHQELARLLIDRGRPAAAADVLRQGLERWPEHPTLKLQLAWVLDLSDERDGSLELLQGLGSAHPAGERSRYNRWPADLLAGGRRALAEVADARLLELDRWLSSRDPADGG